MSRKLQLMLCELEANQLVTILVPSKRHDRRDWDCVRTNVSVNAKWYQKFCALHLSKRAVRRGKPDTICRRKRTIEGLNWLIAGNKPCRPVHDRLLDFAKGYKL